VLRGDENQLFRMVEKKPRGCNPRACERFRPFYG
jgi:hypothetical protein